MKICFVASELAPLAKTGGLADVSAALVAYLDRSGHDVRALLPFYSNIEASGLAVTPVDYLQDIPMRLGQHTVSWSIDTAQLPGSDVMIYLLRCPALYQRDGIYTSGDDEHLRFVALCRAALEMCQRMAFAPDIVHCNDWHTAMVPIYLRTLYGWDRLFARTRTVLTIHNIGYQGIFGSHILHDTGLTDAAHLLYQEDLQAGRINFLKTGLLYATAITAVSPTYAQEIQTDQYGMGLQALLRERRESLIGILNGVDYDEWSPETDPHLSKNYSAGDLAGKEENKRTLLTQLNLDYDPAIPLIGFVSRLVYQKGVDLIEQVLPTLMARRRFNVVALGSGEQRYEQFFTWLQHKYPRRVCFYRGFSNPLAHLIEAASDMFLMPSLYEPCGLNQMYSLRYGTVPIVRETGGLADSVQIYDPATKEGTGIVFRDYNAAGLSWAISTALDLYHDKPEWKQIVQNGMRQDYSWDRQGARYLQLYRQLMPAGDPAPEPDGGGKSSKPSARKKAPAKKKKPAAKKAAARRKKRARSKKSKTAKSGSAKRAPDTSSKPPIEG